MASIVLGKQEERIHPAFLEGLRQLRRENLNTALQHFRDAMRESHGQRYAPLYASYHGLTNARLGNTSGLRQCRLAAHFEKQHPDVFFNLAQAEILHGHRRKALEAIRNGLRLDPAHWQLRKLRESLGVRRRPCIRWLNRDHPLNLWLGRWTWGLRLRLQRARRSPA